MGVAFMLRSQILEIARDWKGTPYQHQAAVKNVGADCLGFLRGVYAEMTGMEITPTAPYTRDWAEVASKHKQERMLIAARTYLAPTMFEEIQPADVVLIRVHKGSLVKHCAIITQTDPMRIIHSYDYHGVVESAFPRNWLDKDLYYFRFKEVE